MDLVFCSRDGVAPADRDGGAAIVEHLRALDELEPRTSTSLRNAVPLPDGIVLGNASGGSVP
jgi:hypothetical protein